jgi:pimeloyl-ACP methyl ester carboxylesterase
MTTITALYLNIHQQPLHYLETGPDYSTAILLLHGASFTAQTWSELGTLTWLAQQGYHVIALDLPGFGKSASFSHQRHRLLSEIIISLNLTKPIIISPSMSGQYSLPLVVNHPEQVGGLVAVAPVGIPTFEAQLTNTSVPILAIWGSNDHIVPVTQAERLCQLTPSARKVILPNAGHACYLQAKEDFHHHLLEFIQSCQI